MQSSKRTVTPRSTLGALAVAQQLAPMSRLKSLLSTLPKLDVTNWNTRTFTVFPQFPPELRLKIWRIASFYSRIFDFNSARFMSTERSRLYHHLVERLNNVSAVLHVNRESWTEALKHFTYHCESEIDAWAKMNSPGPSPERSEWVKRHRVSDCSCQIYLNLEIDPYRFL